MSRLDIMRQEERELRELLTKLRIPELIAKYYHRLVLEEDEESLGIPEDEQAVYQDEEDLELEEDQTIWPSTLVIYWLRS